MSRGTRAIVIRVPDELVAQVVEMLASRNARTADVPWTFSDWVRQAIHDKLAHYRRGNAKAIARRARKEGGAK